MRPDPKKHWELPTDEPSFPSAPKPTSRRQLSLRTFLLAICLIGAALGVAANIARRLQIAATPIVWRRLTLDDVEKIAAAKRHVIALVDPNAVWEFGDNRAAYNNSAVRLQIHQYHCETWYIPSGDLEVFLALKKHHPEIYGARDFLLLDQGRIIPKRGETSPYALARELAAFSQRNR